MNMCSVHAEYRYIYYGVGKMWRPGGRGCTWRVAARSNVPRLGTLTFAAYCSLFLFVVALFAQGGATSPVQGMHARSSDFPGNLPCRPKPFSNLAQPIIFEFATDCKNVGNRTDNQTRTSWKQ